MLVSRIGHVKDYEMWHNIRENAPVNWINKKKSKTNRPRRGKKKKEKRKKRLKSLGRNAKMHNLGIECIFQQKGNSEFTHTTGKKKIAILVQQFKEKKLLVPN